jgi:hypothetical protein
MVRRYKRKTSRLTEPERGLHLTVSARRAPDIELLARVIVDMAMTDPLGLHPSEHDTSIPTLEVHESRK